MPEQTICKIVRQYNKVPVSGEDMQKLQEIAKDCASVKNYVFGRYGGIKSLSKLYPGYTVQNEMTKSGLRESLGLPSVYFYLAVFDALKEIKLQWGRVKAAVLKRVNAHEKFTEEEKHFLRYLLKVSNAFESALNRTKLKLPEDLQRQYEFLASQVEAEKLERYLRRQVRKYVRKLHTEEAEGFSIGERAYRYADHGIYISVKQKRKRIFIPLTDGNRYVRQIYIRLYPDQGGVELQVPVYVAVKSHADYGRQVGLSMGMRVMLVTDEGHLYGMQFGEYQKQLSDWLSEQTVSYQRNRKANSGRKKYQAKKRRLEEQLHSYINQELNRLLRTEKPAVLYLPKLPGTGVSGPAKKMNYLVSTWQRGYIRSRLRQKCQEQSVEFVEVFGKDISNLCSHCQARGTKNGGKFFCSHCGYEEDQKINAARNAKKRGTASDDFRSFGHKSPDK